MSDIVLSDKDILTSILVFIHVSSDIVNVVKETIVSVFENSSVEKDFTANSVEVKSPVVIFTNIPRNVTQADMDGLLKGFNGAVSKVTVSLKSVHLVMIYTWEYELRIDVGLHVGVLGYT